MFGSRTSWKPTGGIGRDIGTTGSMGRDAAKKNTKIYYGVRLNSFIGDWK